MSSRTYRKVAPTAIEERIDGNVVAVEVQLPDEPLPPGKGFLAQILALVAQGLLSFLPPRETSRIRDETSQHRTPTDHLTPHRH